MTEGPYAVPPAPGADPLQDVGITEVSSVSNNISPSKRKRSDSQTSVVSVDNAGQRPRIELSPDHEPDDDLRRDMSVISLEENLYDPSAEAPPFHAAYHEKVVDIRNDTRDMVRKAADVIITSNFSNNETENILQQVNAALEVPPARVQTIAILGDAGVGKSSLINSVLHMPDLANTASLGSSCTSVAMEYRSPFPDQTSRLAARVSYLSTDAIKKFLETHIRQYGNYHFEDHEGWSEQELQDSRLEAYTCEDILIALFGDREEAGYQNADQVLATLREANEDPEKNVVDELVELCEDLLSDKSTDNDGCYDLFEHDQAEALQNLLEPCISTTLDIEDGSKLWPLVEKVCVGVKDVDVLKNITIVDLPGISDTNQVRVNACVDRLRACDALWIVAKIERIVTDKQVDILLQQYGERFAGRISVIATSTDSNVSEDMLAMAKKLKRVGANLANFDKLTQSHGYLKASLTRCQQRLQRKGPSATMEDLMQRAALERESNELEQERFAILVKARVAIVKARLKDAKDITFEVFCVSNKLYNQLTTGEIQNSFFSVSETEIPALRTYMRQLQGPYLWRELRTHTFGTLEVLLRRLEFYASNRRVEDPAKLLSTVRKPRTTLTKLCDSMRDAFNQETDLKLQQPLIAVQDNLIEGAEIRINRWREKLYWSTIRAIVRRFGHWQARGETWNQDLMQPATPLVNVSWASMNTTKMEQIDSFDESAVTLMKDAQQEIEQSSDAALLDMDTIRNLVSGHIERIHHVIAEFREDYVKADADIKLDALQERHTSHFVQAIHNTYLESQNDRGIGWTNRWRDRFLAKMTTTGNRSPFKAWGLNIARAISNNAERTTKKLKKQLWKETGDFEREFKQICEPSHGSSAREAALRQSIQKYLDQAKKTLKVVQNRVSLIESEVSLQLGQEEVA